MYQAAEEGEGGRDVGEAGGLSEGRPNSQNSTETPLNPAKWVAAKYLPFFVCTSLSLSNWIYILYLFAKSEQNNESFPRLFHSLSIGSLFSAKSRAEQVFDWHKELHWSTRDNVWAHADISKSHFIYSTKLIMMITLRMAKCILAKGCRATQCFSSSRHKPPISAPNQCLQAIHRWFLINIFLIRPHHNGTLLLLQIDSQALDLAQLSFRRTGQWTGMRSLRRTVSRATPIGPCQLPLKL